MYVYIYVCVYIYIYIYICVCVCMCVSVCVCALLHYIFGCISMLVLKVLDVIIIEILFKFFIFLI